MLLITTALTFEYWLIPLEINNKGVKVDLTESNGYRL